MHKKQLILTFLFYLISIENGIKPRGFKDLFWNKSLSFLKYLGSHKNIVELNTLNTDWVCKNGRGRMSQEQIRQNQRYYFQNKSQFIVKVEMSAGRFVECMVSDISVSGVCIILINKFFGERERIPLRNYRKITGW